MTCNPTRHRPRGSRRLAGWLVLLIGAFTLIPGGAATAQASAPQPQPQASPPSFAVQPSGPDGPGNRDWFTYTLDPGAVFGDTVAISNLSDHPIRFFIYSTDAVSVADVGGFGAMKDGEKPVDVGTWIRLAASEHTVQPGTRIDVPFSVTVPQDAEPGDHAGAILAVDADQGGFDPNSSPDGLSFSVKNRIGARVYVRVSGPTSPALRIDKLDVRRDGSSATITWEALNSGNLRLSPTSQVRITGLFGRTVRTLPAEQMPELLPGANYVGASIVRGLPALEPLTAHLVLTAPDARTERSDQFRSYPWLLMALVLLIAMLGWGYRRRRKAAPPAPGTGPNRSRERVPVGA